MVRGGVLACWLLAGCDLVFPIGSGLSPSLDGPIVDPDGGCGSLRLLLDFESPDLGMDRSGCGHDAMIAGAFPGTAPDGRTALDVGPSSVVVVGETAALDFSGPFTLAAWIYVDAIGPPDSTGWVLRNPEQYGVSFTIGASVHCDLGTGVTADAAIQYSAWRHVACTTDGTTTTAYVDGAARGCAPQTPRGNTGNEGTRLGSAGSGVETLDALLDDVRIYGRALDASEVCVLSRSTACAAGCP